MLDMKTFRLISNSKYPVPSTPSIPWGNKIENYVAMLHFACAWITYRSGELFG